MSKTIIVAMVLSISTLAQAKAVYRYNSTLPTGLQSIVAAVISYSCDVSNVVVWEDKTTISKEHVDQQMYDYHYTTTFKVGTSMSDASTSTIEVVSFDINMQNPTAGVSVGVLSIKSNKINCR